MLKRHIALCCSIALFACLFIACAGGDGGSGSVLKPQSVKNSHDNRTESNTESHERSGSVVPETVGHRTPAQTTNSNPIPKLEKKHVPPEMEPDPEDEEKAAEKLAKLAVEQIRNNRIGEARKLMEEIVKHYPNTDTAEEIRKMLKSIR